MAELLESLAAEVGRLGESGIDDWPGTLPWTASPGRCVVAALVRPPAR
jgi:hypothetical protein